MKNTIKEVEKRKKRRKLLIKTLNKLKKDGVLFKEIAKQLNVDPSRVSRIVRGEDLYLSNLLVERYLDILLK